MAHRIATALVALLFLTLTGCGEDAPPYTYNELIRGEGLCNAKSGAAALTSDPYDGSDADHLDCLRNKFPELTERQLKDFHATTERVRIYEDQQALEN
jgi:hypothetical protein